MILAGDVGGTKTNLGLFRVGEEGGLERVVDKRLPSADYDGLPALLRAFVESKDVDLGTVEAACFGVAGPVVGNHADPPNLPWDVDGDAVAEDLGLHRALVINDLVATGFGLEILDADQLETLQPGDPDPEGNRVLVAAGTGLGGCPIQRVDDRWLPMEGEPGHADFAPRNEDEFDLLRYLRHQRGLDRVSVERVVSGSGLVSLYEYLGDRGMEGSPGCAVRVQELQEAGEDPAPEITEAALESRCPRAERALEMFVSAYGAAVGNLALVTFAVGGVYLGGGIAPKILEHLKQGPFLESFHAKGRFREVMERMPVTVLLEPETALWGAARRAMHLLRET